MQKQQIHFDDTAIAFAPKSNRELRKTLFVFSSMKRPWMVKLGVSLTKFGLNWGLPIKSIIKNTIYAQFCGGESVEETKPTVNKLAEFNVKTILDYAVEGESIEIGFDKTRDEIVKICKAAKNDANIPFCVVKPTGVGSMDVLKKAQRGDELTEKEKLKLQMFSERLHDIAQAAKENGLMFMVDAEESWIQDVVDDVVYDLMREFNKDYVHVFNTMQMYRHDMLGNLKEAIEIARAEGFHFGVKVVRGAYMEKERRRAAEKGYESPIQPDKASTDRDYDEALRHLLDNIDITAICTGTHNEQSCLFLTELMGEKGIEPGDHRIFFSQLLGMSDGISFNLAESGYNVAKYVPYGPIDKVMPYLFRRAKENTAISGQSSRELTMVQKEVKRRKSAK